MHVDSTTRRHASREGNLYTTLFIDDFSRWITIAHHESRDKDIYLKMLRDVESRLHYLARRTPAAQREPAFAHPPLTYHTDNEGSIVSKLNQKRLKKQGRGLLLVVPGSKNHAAVVERANRTMLDISRVQLAASGLPVEDWWQRSHDYAIWIHNRTPSRTLPGNASPYKMIFEKEPCLRRARVWGCIAWMHLAVKDRDLKSKLSASARQVIFVGIPPDSRSGWYVWDPRSDQIYHRHSLIWCEDKPGSTLLAKLGLTAPKAISPPAEKAPTQLLIDDDGWASIFHSRRGQSMRDIAQELDIDMYALIQHNANVPGSDPHSQLVPPDSVLKPGTGLWIPTGHAKGDSRLAGTREQEKQPLQNQPLQNQPLQKLSETDSDDGEPFSSNSNSDSDKEESESSQEESSDEEPPPRRRSKRIRDMLQQRAEPISGPIGDLSRPEKKSKRRKSLILELAEVAARAEVKTLQSATALLCESADCAKEVVRHWAEGDDFPPPEVQKLYQRSKELYNAAFLTEIAASAQTRRIRVDDIKTPKNYADAMRSDHADLWREAFADEINNLANHEVFEIVPRKSVPRGTRIFSTRVVWKAKPEENTPYLSRAKARIVARGFGTQAGRDHSGDVFSPVTATSTWRALCAQATRPHWKILTVDVRSAYLTASMPSHSVAYVEVPDGYPAPTGSVLKCRKAIYGLPLSAKIFYQQLKKHLQQMGFQCSPHDQALFSYESRNNKSGTPPERILLCTHVDDLLVTASSEQALRIFVGRLEEVYSFSLDSNTRTYLSVEISRLPSGAIQLSQREYTRHLLETYGFTECRSVRTPAEHGHYPTVEDCPKTEEEKKEAAKMKYRQLLGGLLFLAQTTRIDCRWAVGQAARFASNPGKKHYQLLTRILRYLSKYPDLCLTFGRQTEGVIHAPLYAACDASWAGCKDTRRSCSGFVVFSYSGVIHWASRAQRSIALSSTEAEVMAATEVTKCLVWLRRIFLENFGYKPQDLVTLGKQGLTDAMWINKACPITILEDNQSAIAISKNPVLPRASRHIALRYLYVRQEVLAGTVKLVFCPSDQNCADLLTKSVTPAVFERLRDRMMHPREAPVTITERNESDDSYDSVGVTDESEDSDSEH